MSDFFEAGAPDASIASSSTPAPAKEKPIPKRFNRATHARELFLRLSAPEFDSVALAELVHMRIGSGEFGYQASIITDQVKDATNERLLATGTMYTEGQVFLEWLKGYEFVRIAVENILSAKPPSTKGLKKTLGSVVFLMMYHAIDSFAAEVNICRDDARQLPSFAIPGKDTNPSAIQAGEHFLSAYDATMVKALARYKSETENDSDAAQAIGDMEDSLARALWLLSEHLGYGGPDDLGFSLLEDTREEMMSWKTSSAYVDSDLSD
ncbi:hypothetical protein PLICRDRAFT_44097 [Plicaturopsis crispa FD-325 SS-3]|nr:hypothetical protein PLICRDRAFT_44097 [Plicaturopsis crispa FD-325 SS-3]